jgi:hypothetical protein
MEIAYTSFRILENQRQTSRWDETCETLTRVLPYAQILVQNPAALAKFCCDNGIKLDGRASDDLFQPLVKALFPKEERADRRSLITLHAQMLWVWTKECVKPHEAVRWLNEPEDVKGDGKSVSGSKKIRAYWNKYHPQNSRKKSTDTERPKAVDEEVSKATFAKVVAEARKHGAIATAPPSEATKSLRGRQSICYCETLQDGTTQILMKITTDPQAVREEVLKFVGQPSTG